jgi:hypothetical protein
LDDVIENFAEHGERYDIAPGDAENVWLTITQDVHDQRLPIKMKIEHLHLLSDNFAFVVNLDIVGSSEMGADELGANTEKSLSIEPEGLGYGTMVLDRTSWSQGIVAGTKITSNSSS